MNLNLTMIAQAITFALFIWFTMKVVWPYLLRAIETRQKVIADGLAEAERGKSSLADAQKQTDIMLREARGRAQEIVAAAEKAAQQRRPDPLVDRPDEERKRDGLGDQREVQVHGASLSGKSRILSRRW